MKKISGI